jgi:hypothetical protein
MVQTHDHEIVSIYPFTDAVSPSAERLSPRGL